MKNTCRFRDDCLGTGTGTGRTTVGEHASSAQANAGRRRARRNLAGMGIKVALEMAALTLVSGCNPWGKPSGSDQPSYSDPDDTASRTEARSFVTLGKAKSVPSSSTIKLVVFEQPDGSAAYSISYLSRLNELTLSVSVPKFEPPAMDASVDISVPEFAQVTLAANGRAGEAVRGTVMVVHSRQWTLGLKGLAFQSEDGTPWVNEEMLGEVTGSLERACMRATPENDGQPRAINEKGGRSQPGLALDAAWSSPFCQRFKQ
jgi:hypothetical protein